MGDVHVAIVGAGIAGLTATLRLLERGYSVTLIEQSDQIGGKWGVLKRNGLYYEHAYHMFLNWYNNFWVIVQELGLTDNFEPRTALRCLRPGDFPHNFSTLRDVGSLSSIWPNLFSGVEPVPDMFLGAYSSIDLLTQPIDRQDFLDQYSVNGFMQSRPYATNQAARLHENTLAKAFASPSYHTSAATYKKFLQYSLRYPSPLMWVLKGNCYDYFHKTFQAHLDGFNHKRQKKKFIQKMLTGVKRLCFDAERVSGLTMARMYRTEADPEVLHTVEPTALSLEENFDYVILAVPPKALGQLVDETVFQHAPELANVNKLRTEPMASLDLYFNKKLPHLPKEHVVLLGSKYDLTFIDNSQLWPSSHETECRTVLNVVAPNIDPLVFFDRVFIQKCLIEELQNYIPFNHETDIDYEKTFTQRNTGEQLFVNDVGSWTYRPKTTCRIPNLFIAGDYCQTFIDVVSIEGAVVSGLLAVQELQAQVIADGKATLGDALCQPVEIIEPESHPDVGLRAYSLLWAPYAYAARWWSLANDAWGTH